MPDPDKPSTSTTFVYGSTIAIGILAALVVIMLYSYQKEISAGFIPFNLIIWIILPLLFAIFAFGLNSLGQFIACNRVNLKNSGLSVLPVLGFLYGALLVSHISYMRAPIASLFVQLPNVTLLDAERARPVIKGISIGYYVFFGILFGQIFSSGLSQACSAE